MHSEKSPQLGEKQRRTGHSVTFHKLGSVATHLRCGAIFSEQ